MSPFRITTAFLFAFGVMLAASTPVRAEPVRRVVVDRIVAVVDREVITLVEVRRRAEPFLRTLASLDEAARTVAEVRMYRDLVDRIVEERLIARRARMASITVTASEIDTAIDSIAQTNKLSREALLAEARTTGLSEADYRDEIYRQILSFKCLRVYLAGKKKGFAELNDAQMQEASRAMIEESKRDVHIEVRL
ncbi:SurA N-terminal domain-containing protein [Polyangium jinanense]|uniref:SurA N-terminal domain-containing protein n=1 Tax=Polyangium jinanense TaxID=2829994 RepID=A0A9X4B044_9BACT|nr:SurA N-terminal domain-containing protein [Polyangium jinanense]MDC3962337.1 SurA N-terminal domain-containing protein [Polyangium jinanense]MDC3989090.1 SurA N-terminal domain-containing protein [Polyangium jinanense]